MYSEIRKNKHKTIILVAVFLLIILVLVDMLVNIYANGNFVVVIGAMVGALLYALISYHSGMKMSLAVNRAKEIQKSDNPRLYNIVENLSIGDGLPMPKVYIMDDPSPNAFATGKDYNHSAVCATTGLLEIMNDNELTAVMAHEMGHIKNYDSRVSMTVFALTAAISLIADIILRLSFFSDNEENNNSIFMLLGVAAAILSPLLAFLVQMAVSRRREYLADAQSALTTRYPEGLISALQKIDDNGNKSLKTQNTATAHFFFVNPLKSHFLTNLFSTHPPIKDRIMRLQSMGSHD